MDLPISMDEMGCWSEVDGVGGLMVSVGFSSRAVDWWDRFSNAEVAAGEIIEGLVNDVAAKSKEGESLEARLEDIPGETFG